MVDQSEREEIQKDIELFYFAYRSFTARPDRILQELSLGRVHHRILYFVGRNPQLPINELLTILDISKQALNIPLRKLIELELINVSISDKDGRVRLLALTNKGNKLEARLTSPQLKHLETVMAAVGKSSVAGWRKMMGELPFV